MASLSHIFAIVKAHIGGFLIGLFAGVAALAAVLAWRTAGDSYDEAVKTGEDTRTTNAVVRKAAEDARERDAVSTAGFTDPQKLADPGECKIVPRDGITLEGKAQMIHKEELWLLVRPPLEPAFYITSGQPLEVSAAAGKWSAVTGKLGATEDHGQVFQIELVRATINASTILQSAYQREGKISTLPGGAEVMTSACVRRE